MDGLSSVVETVVDEKVTANEMFTAFDVTTEIRNRGHRVKHNDVRDIVHDCYNRGTMGVAYARTNISVAGQTPLLYHRSVDDPLNYGTVNTSVAVSPVSNVIPPVNLIVKNSNIGRTVDRSVDGRGTLSIPTTLLVKAGLKPKDKVFATANQASVEISKADANVPNGLFTCYTVDEHNQVRITQNFLTQAGLAGNSYDISESNDKVVVKLHV